MASVHGGQTVTQAPSTGRRIAAILGLVVVAFFVGTYVGSYRSNSAFISAESARIWHDTEREMIIHKNLLREDYAKLQQFLASSMYWRVSLANDYLSIPFARWRFDQAQLATACEASQQLSEYLGALPEDEFQFLHDETRGEIVAVKEKCKKAGLM